MKTTTKISIAFATKRDGWVVTYDRLPVGDDRSYSDCMAAWDEACKRAAACATFELVTANLNDKV